MEPRNNVKIVLFLVMVTALFFCEIPLLAATELKLTGRHPIELSEQPRCTECHGADAEVGLKPIEVYNHDVDWIGRHRFFASRGARLCDVCHQTSFCTDCHAYKEQLKPSDKHSEATEQWLPHRGDYLFQHRIDGRLDPTSCFRCHGRQNNEICRRCHK